MFELIARLVHTGGLWAVFLLMVLENLVPVIPSEVILPLAGFEAAQGRMGAIAAVLAGGVGSTVGVIPWFWAARKVGATRFRGWSERHGRWLALAPHEVDAAALWLARFGGLAVLVGRALPSIRGVIAIPAGLARLSWPMFLAACLAGSTLWSALLVWAGLKLQAHYAEVGDWVSPLADALLVLGLMLYLWRVATRPQPIWRRLSRRRRDRSRPSEAPPPSGRTPD